VLVASLRLINGGILRSYNLFNMKKLKSSAGNRKSGWAIYMGKIEAYEKGKLKDPKAFVRRGDHNMMNRAMKLLPTERLTVDEVVKLINSKKVFKCYRGALKARLRNESKTRSISKQVNAFKLVRATCANCV
jgi:hypothetical protein